MKRDDEQMVLLATSIAMQLASGLSNEEIQQLKNLINQILCSLSTLLNCHSYSENKAKHFREGEKK